MKVSDMTEKQFILAICKALVINDRLKECITGTLKSVHYSIIQLILRCTDIEQLCMYRILYGLYE